VRCVAAIIMLETNLIPMLINMFNSKPEDHEPDKTSLSQNDASPDIEKLSG